MSEATAAAAALLTRCTAWAEDRLATLAWWTDAELLRALGPGLAALFPSARPTLIAGVQSSGYLLAPLVAMQRGVGMLAVQKQPQPDGSILLATLDDVGGVAGRPRTGDRVLLVDDVVETGAQVAAVKDLVVDSGAEWLGAAVMVAYQPRPDLGVESLTTVACLRSAAG
ncbi:MAG TPA: hypothetical protein H9881_12085 [Candidatus Stackebrandtia excrementipullorum]|nr:hypothetical protein [Candidatus Stackebrandtia excrementipullorum]